MTGEPISLFKYKGKVDTHDFKKKYTCYVSARQRFIQTPELEADE